MYPFNLMFHFSGAYQPSDECQAWLDELPSQPSDAFIETIDTYLFKPLVSNNIFSELDVLNVGAQEVEAHASYDLANPTRSTLSISAGLTWIQYEGWTGDGVSRYVVSNYNPSADGVNFQLNNASLFAYIRTNDTNNNCVVGAIDGTSPNRTFTQIRGQFGTTTFGALSENVGDLNPTTNMIGLHHLKRTASNSQVYYKNGSSVDTSTQVSTALVNKNLFYLARNYDGTVANHSALQGSIWGAGSSNIDPSTLSSILNGYMTQLSKNVY